MEMTAMIRTRPTKVQGMAFERTVLALEDSNGTQTLPHTCFGIKDSRQVCRRRWYHLDIRGKGEVNVKAAFWAAVSGFSSMPYVSCVVLHKQYFWIYNIYIQ
jgi:hypothetical protein